MFSSFSNCFCLINETFFQISSSFQKKIIERYVNSCNCALYVSAQGMFFSVWSRKGMSRAASWKMSLPSTFNFSSYSHDALLSLCKTPTGSLIIVILLCEVQENRQKVVPQVSCDLPRPTGKVTTFYLVGKTLEM